MDDYQAMNEEDERKWNAMLQQARDLGASEAQIKQVFGEYKRTLNIYDRQAKWVLISMLLLCFCFTTNTCHE